MFVNRFVIYVIGVPSKGHYKVSYYIYNSKSCLKKRTYVLDQVVVGVQTFIYRRKKIIQFIFHFHRARRSIWTSGICAVRQALLIGTRVKLLPITVEFFKKDKVFTVKRKQSKKNKFTVHTLKKERFSFLHQTDHTWVHTTKQFT